MIVYNTCSRAGTNLTWELLVNHCFSDFSGKEIKCSKGGLGTFKVNLSRFTCDEASQYKPLPFLIIHCIWMYCCLLGLPKCYSISNYGNHESIF